MLTRCHKNQCRVVLNWSSEMIDGSFFIKPMARQFLRLGNREIPVTDEQVRQLNANRFNPKKVAEIRLAIFATARVKTESAGQAVSATAVPVS